MKTIVSICSARPNFVKVAAVHHALAAYPEEFTHLIIHTGQHYDPLLSDVFFQELKIPDPAKNLGVKGGGGDREAIIQATTEAMIPALEELKPDIVLVYGDVNGAIGAARAAKKLGINIGHVEAGLRSGDRIPEELNRIEIDRLADELFTTEESANENLKKDPAVRGSVHFVGNTMIDTLLRMMPTIDKAPLPEGLPTDYAVATFHRSTNVDDNGYLIRIFDLVGAVAAHIPVVLPLHPRTLHIIEESAKTGQVITIPPNVVVVPPHPYIEFIRLLKSSSFIITDSGGIQEEAVLLKKRCFTIRKSTERPVTIESGSNTVIADIADPVLRKILTDYAADPKPAQIKTPPLWDGQAGERIVEVLRTL